MFGFRAVRNSLWILLLFARPAWSADVVSLDDSDMGLSRAFKQLSTTVSVLHVVAHPDDEDGPLLAYCARGLGTRTMLFSVTRGEGGANLISGDFFDRLGALRSLEHVKSASYYGNELFYSRAVDYGYSKTIDEAKRQWQNGEPILADLVALIRRERPTILLSRFRGDHHDGHGHHQLAGVLSEQAVLAAADPNAFPDQLQRGLKTWQVTKLYTNNLRPEWRPADQDLWTVAVPTGTFDSTLGRSYAQIARFGLGFQRSQGFGGHDGEPGPRDSYYRLVRMHGQKAASRRESSILEGIDGRLVALVAGSASDETKAILESSLQAIAKPIEDAHNAFRSHDRSAVVAALLASLRAARTLAVNLPKHDIADSDRAILAQHLDRKISELHQALRCVMAIDVRAVATREPAENASAAETRYAVPGDKLKVVLRAVHQHHSPVEFLNARLMLAGETLQASNENPAKTIARNEVLSLQQSVEVPVGAEPTRPSWSRRSIQTTLYDVTKDHRFEPLPRPALTADLEVVVDGEKLSWQIPVEVIYRDAVMGDVRYPMDVVPALRIGFALNNGVLPRGTNDYQVELVAANASSTERNVAVTLSAPDGWTTEPLDGLPEKLTANDSVRIGFRVQPPADLQEADVVLRAEIIDLSTKQSYTEDVVPITAPDLGRLHWYLPAEHRLRRIDVQVAGTPRVGYVRGSGDEVAESLRWLGIHPEFLEAGDLAAGDLSVYDVILVGVRAYAVREDLRRWNSRLLEYVHAGGTLIVQYQTPEFDQNFGPYPYTMGNNPEEVSEEDATITVLEPKHRLFHFPNEITKSDFDGWVEQRGSKFWTSWDSHYLPLLECHDADQAPQRGGFLIAQHGRGTYVYSAYAWYRQLPQGVPGAYRLVANMLSLPKESDNR